MTWHKRDPIMTRLVKTLPQPESKRREDLYLALLDSVVGQQLSTKVADVIFARFIRLFPDSYPDAKKLLRMKDEKLRAIGLSMAKIRYVKNIAEHHLKEPITFKRMDKMTDEEIILELTSIKGVGPWTVQMMLMFPMDRPDVFSVGDLIIRQMMVEHYDVKEKGAALLKKLHLIAEGWKPNRTLACRYLWNSNAALRAAKKAAKTTVKKTAKPPKKASAKA
jgi:DNA-3-methyladenine glycosylase II